jgi:nitrogen regulatory protein PII
MKACKRIEVVIEQTLSTRVAELLDELGAPGYTLLGSASGKGDRGTRRANESTGTFTNCVFVVACDDDGLTQRIVEGIRPLLSVSGGVCLVSDAMWVRH